jgi:predicted nucleotidyltransferase
MPEISDKIKNILYEYVQEISKKYKIEKVILFGSCASNQNNQDSDVDLAIFSSQFNDKNRIRIMNELLMMVYKFKIDIQPLAFSYSDFLKDDNSFISNEIKKNGIEIYHNT